MRRVERPSVTPDLGTAALRAARAVAHAHGLPTDDPRVLSGGANLVVHLAPAPVVAKAAASSRTVRDAGAFLARELTVAATLRAAGLPVVAPSGAVPARVHEHDGVAVTFWQLVPPGPPARPAADLLGVMLAELHAALRASELELPRLAPLDDIPQFAAREGRMPARERGRIGDAYERIVAALPRDVASEQPLHGDAHPSNLLRTASGELLWCDFEDTCSGPVHWDLAAVRRTPHLDGAAAVRAYTRASGRDDLADAQLAPWIALRELHLAVWRSLYEERGLPSAAASRAPSTSDSSLP
jgi:Ser/Thr protein kinase RdoA (MazF antagonist)